MDAIRTLARLGRAAREEAGIKVRQPLAGWCASRQSVERSGAASRLVPLLAAELNVKQVEFATIGRRPGDARGETELPGAG